METPISQAFLSAMPPGLTIGDSGVGDGGGESLREPSQKHLSVQSIPGCRWRSKAQRDAVSGKDCTPNLAV